MRILMFAPGFAPYAASENIVNSKLAWVFLSEGIDLQIISRKDSAYYGSEWQEPWMNLKGLTHEVTFEFGNALDRFMGRLIDTIKMHYPIAGLRWASRAFDLAMKLHEQKPFSIVLSRSTPDIAHLPAMRFSCKTNLPWMANWNDPTKMPYPYGEGTNEDIGFFNERFLKAVSRKANLHTFPCERLRRYICSYLPIDIGKTKIIPHVSITAREYHATTKKENQFTICHAGYLGGHRNPTSFFEGLKLMIDKKGIINLRFINIGPDDKNLFQLAQKYDLESFIELKGPMNYLDTLDLLSASDVLVIIEAPCAEGIFLPSKFVDYVEIGKPILCISPHMGTLQDIIGAKGGGLVADCTSSDDITSALIKLYNSWEEHTLYQQYNSSHLRDLFKPGLVINQYKDIFQSIC